MFTAKCLSCDLCRWFPRDYARINGFARKRFPRTLLRRWGSQHVAREIGSTTRYFCSDPGAAPPFEAAGNMSIQLTASLRPRVPWSVRMNICYAVLLLVAMYFSFCHHPGSYRSASGCNAHVRFSYFASLLSLSSGVLPSPAAPGGEIVFRWWSRKCGDIARIACFVVDLGH